MQNKNLLPYSISGFETELLTILNWWINNTIDHRNKSGGYIGRISGINSIDPLAPKGSVLNSRILWSFSAAANVLPQNKDFYNAAVRAYNFVDKYLFDSVNGGVYWSINSDGSPLDNKKQIYAQAFAIYGLSEYYKLTNNEEALEKAIQLFHLMQSKAMDKNNGGYFEAFTEDWSPLENVNLSDKEGNDVKTMNTHLHIMEAYTTLAQVSNITEIKVALSGLVNLFCEKFIDVNTGRLKLFFNETWNENFHHLSYGHAIETVWLLNEAALETNDDQLIERCRNLSLIIAENTLSEGIDNNNAIQYERDTNGNYYHQREWWTQAEGVVGFYDAYQQSGEEKYLKISQNCWTFIQQYLKDYQNGEWYWGVDENGNPNTKDDKVGIWKCPYHNSRMCIEMIKRLSN